MTQSTATTAVTPSIESGFKRADRRSTITVLVLGDGTSHASSVVVGALCKERLRSVILEGHPDQDVRPAYYTGV